MGRLEVYTGFLVGIMRERNHLEDIAVDGGDNIKTYLQEV
jgi:hypothetical protein